MLLVWELHLRTTEAGTRSAQIFFDELERAYLGQRGGLECCCSDSEETRKGLNWACGDGERGMGRRVNRTSVI